MTMQHPIDLLPSEIFERSQAGLRAGRLITAMVLMTLTAVALITHGRLTVMEAEQRLSITKTNADRVLEIERKTQGFRVRQQQLLAEMRTYDMVAHPLPLHRVIATVINELPDSATVEAIEVTAGARRTSRSPRRRMAETEDERLPRVLVGEIAGFAGSDGDIAELVRRLQSRPPFDRVALDFSRTRTMRGRSAREFRLSFRIDLERNYVIVDQDETIAGVPVMEARP
ncbi:MAG: PilN domain-containing protein [Planctomycetota bacterium]